MREVREIPILDVAEKLGLEVQKKMTRCVNPNHEDEHPSMSFNEKENYFHCFACGYSGDAVDLIKTVRGCNFKDTLDWLADNMNIRISYNRSRPTAPSYTRPIRKGDKSVLLCKKDIEIYEALIQALDLSGEGKEFLTRRGILEEYQNQLKLRFLGDPEAAFNNLKQKFSIEELKHAGLINEKEEFIFRQKSVIIPFIDDEITYLQARKLSGKPKYINLLNKSKQLYNLKAVDENDKIYVVEGVFDVMALMQVGFPAVAIQGSGIREEYYERFRDKEIILFFDNDETGRKYTDQFIKRLKPIAKSVVMFNYKSFDGNDPNEIITKLQEGKMCPFDIKNKLENSIILAISSETENILNEMYEIENDQYIHPAQDFTDGMLYYGVTIGSKFYLINSRKELIRQEDALSMTNKRRPSENCSFSKAGIDSYLHSREKMNPGKLFTDILECLKKYVYFTDLDNAIVLALWIMATYVFRIFNYSPYIWLTGEKQSGKTVLMSIAKDLAFNGIMASDFTVSPLFRTINSNRSTLFIDEFETLSLSDREKYNALKGILNSGYEINARIFRSEKDGNENFTPKSFDIYGPKCFASISSIDEVLLDRVIKIPMLKCPPSKHMPRRRYNADQKIMSNLRDCLYKFGLDYALEIHDIYDQLANRDENQIGLDPRELDLFEPIFTIASIVDEYSKDNGILEKMHNFAKKLHAEKKVFNSGENETEILLRAVNSFIRARSNIFEDQQAYYLKGNDFFEYFKRKSYFEENSKKKLTHLLRRKLEIASIEKSLSGVKDRYYVVNKEKLRIYNDSYPGESEEPLMLELPAPEPDKHEIIPETL